MPAPREKFIGVIEIPEARVSVVTGSKEYLYAEFKTPTLGFVDDDQKPLLIQSPSEFTYAPHHDWVCAISM
jgi:uncharacterized protein (DUF1499 family)